MQIHNRSSEDLPFMVLSRPHKLNVEHFNTTEIYYEGENWRAIVLTYNVFIIRRYGVWRILMLYCMCTGQKCSKYCLCNRFCLPCCELCYRQASPHKKDKIYQHVLEDTSVEAKNQYMGQWILIKNEMENRMQISFRHVDLSKESKRCEYYGQVSNESKNGESTTSTKDGAEEEVMDEEGIRIPENIINDDVDEGVMNEQESSTSSLSSSSSTSISSSIPAVSSITESSYLPGTRVAVYDGPVSGKGKSRPSMIGRGIITYKKIDGSRYLDRPDYPNVAINYTKSRKEVKFSQLVSKNCCIPYLNKYYEKGAKFVDVFGQVSRFECLIAESHLGIDVLAMENDIIEAVLGDDDTDDLGDREPGGKSINQDLLKIGTDDEIRAIMENDRLYERLYVSRNDERLGLNENHDDYLMENDE